MQNSGLENVEVLGWFGRDLQGKYSEDESQVLQYSYLKLPEGLDWDKEAFLQVDWDLTVPHKDDEKRFGGVTYEHILQWITQHCRNQQGEHAMPDADFVCKRRHLAYLMEAAQSDHFPHFWYLLAKRVRGVIHFSVFWDDVKKSREENMHTQLRPGDRYGPKFEHYLLADTQDGTADPTRPIRRYDDMALVYRAKLGRHSVLYVGETDGLPDDIQISGLPYDDQVRDLNTARFVELKTTTFNPKWGFMFNWWSRCVLSNCERLLLGLRDKKGHVRTLEWLTVDEMERMAKGWSPKSMVDWAQDALDTISSEMQDCEDGEVRMFEKTAHGLVLSTKDPPQYALDPLFPEFYEQWTSTAQARSVPQVTTPPTGTCAQQQHGTQLGIATA